MHNTIERPRQTAPTRWVRWAASPVAHFAVIAAIILGFCAWGVLVDGQSIADASTSGLGVAAIYLALVVASALVSRYRRT